MEMMSKPIKTDPKLLALLAKAKDHKMTPEERAAQRKSWVIGNMMLDHPEMSREEVERIYSEVI
jgi:hypothetical protein